MSFTDDDLVRRGVTKYFKADIILEAVRDLYYLSHIKKNLMERRGVKDDKEATYGTVKIITELISQDYCRLATWGKEKGSFQEVQIPQEELYQLISTDAKDNHALFDFFLIATEKGKEWKSRYEKLMEEL